VRFESVRALRKIGDASIGADLVPLLTYTDTKVRDEAIYTLGRLRYRPAVPELTRLYQQEAALPIRQSDRALRERLLGALAWLVGLGLVAGLIATQNQGDITRAIAVAG